MVARGGPEQQGEVGKLLEKQETWEDRTRLLNLSRLKREIQQEFDELRALAGQRPEARSDHRHTVLKFDITAE